MRQEDGWEGICLVSDLSGSFIAGNFYEGPSKGHIYGQVVMGLISWSLIARIEGHSDCCKYMWLDYKPDFGGGELAAQIFFRKFGYFWSA